ncbi:MAG: superoxide dismutase family protein [Kiloniellales bacterium]|nr:superoxide dismutase family protein [Kiloniellales bacterium]
MLKALLSTIFSTGFVIATVVAVNAQSDSGIGNVSLMTTEGESAGLATLTETPNGVLITADLKNLSVGEHAFHIHETGKCEPDFSAAGGHFAPDGKEHGFSNPAGYHAGDMPNIFAASDGTAKVHVFNTRITLGDGKGSIFDEDGSALVIHADPDSYLKDALAGDRVACGVIMK